jgi:hypothetical protein
MITGSTIISGQTREHFQSGRIPCSIFDLDGCVSDDRWRLAFIDEEKSGYEKYEQYHAGMGADDPFDHAKELIQQLRDKGRKIIFVTARPVKWAAYARQWIERQLGIPAKEFILYMRPTDDERGSVDLKRDIVSKLLLNKDLLILTAYDDRLDVVKMYQELGISAGVMNADGIFDCNADANVLNRLTRERRELRAREEAVEAAPKERPAPTPRTAADILGAAASTFRERNAGYKDNAVNVGLVMKALFPNGVRLLSEEDHHFYHLFELMVVKLTRFANSDLKHKDSIHDLMVYAAMCENLVDIHSIKFGE